MTSGLGLKIGMFGMQADAVLGLTETDAGRHRRAPNRHLQRRTGHNRDAPIS